MSNKIILLDLISIANILDEKKLFKEADILDNIIKKSFKDSNLEYKYEDVNKINIPNQKINFDWPWNEWNSLSEGIKDDFYNTLDKLGWVPILGAGAQSAKFVLKCFEKKWNEAAISLVFILFQFFIAFKLASKAPAAISSAAAASPSFSNYKVIMQNLGKEIAKDMSFKSRITDIIINGTNEIIENVAKSFSESKSFNPLSSELLRNKVTRNLVDKELNKFYPKY